MSDQAKTIQEVQEAVAFMRKKIDEHGQNSAEAKQASARVESALADFDKKNQEMAVTLQSQKAAADEMKGQIQTLEQMLARASSSGRKGYKESAEYKAVNDFIRTGKIDVKSLRMDNAVDGGYLVPTEMEMEIIKNITEISPIRQLARVRTVSKQTLQVPKRTSIPTANYEGELEANEALKSQYGNETLHTYRLGVKVLVTQDLLGDSAFDMESEIANDVAEAMAYKEGNKFVLGTGVGQPEGFAANATLQADARETAGTGAIAGDDILSLLGDLKVGYNPILGFNRSTLSTLRKLKGTSNDHYLWQVGLAPGAPATLGGAPYVLIQDMASIATGNYAVVYADFRQGYRIIDRTGLVTVRDPYTRADYAQIVLNFMRWNDARVVKTEAFKLLKIK